MICFKLSRLNLLVAYARHFQHEPIYFRMILSRYGGSWRDVRGKESELVFSCSKTDRSYLMGDPLRSNHSTACDI
ncbi:hypothetical protein F2Q69_00021317 [Brassica cretica]|uniref:Uncharacterized protein n=1 Tax=Brassica cretica TaxID=69181 RepID=A0A8S9QJP0_BRACR|nr:hypothetical protein F2Q69_00021317 [Brassica cretica]